MMRRALHSTLCRTSNRMWYASTLRGTHRFMNALRHPEQAQHQLLRSILTDNAATAFGRAHGFESIRTWNEFRDRVPLMQPSDLTPWTDRIRRGEEHILTHEPVRRLVPTSGTCSAARLIPWTASLQRQCNAAIHPWINDLFRNHPELMNGPAYWSISPTMQPVTTDSAVPIGFEDDTEYLGPVIKRCARSVLAVPTEVRHCTHHRNWQRTTLFWLLRAADLRLLSVWHPTFLALLLDALTPNWDALVQAVRTGTLQLEEDAAIQTTPMPQRARSLQRCPPADPITIWPRLKVISAWADAAAQQSFNELASRFPGVTLQPKGLLATEGMVSIPYQNHHPLAINTHALEFRRSDGSFALAHELDVGDEYDVILTTGGGLYRYNIGDSIRVDSMIQRTPSIRFVGRSSAVSDMRGEKISDAQAGAAIDRIRSACTLNAQFIALAPSPKENPPRYELLTSTAPAHIDHCLNTLDSELSRNPHYGLCRTLGQLAPPTWRIVPDNFENGMLTRKARSTSIGNVKPTHLITDHAILQTLRAGRGKTDQPDHRNQPLAQTT